MERQKLKIKVKAKRRGFTLAEVLAVVLVISLLASLGGGIYVGTFKRMLVEKAARSLLLTAKYARIMAIERQTQYKMHLDLTNGEFYLATTQYDEEAEQSAHIIVRDPYCKPVQFEGDVKFEDIQVTPISWETSAESGSEEEQTIVFLPNGTADSAVIQIGDDKTHYTVSISAATGKAKVYFGTTENVTSSTVDLDAE